MPSEATATALLKSRKSQSCAADQTARRGERDTKKLLLDCGREAVFSDLSGSVFEDGGGLVNE